MHPSSTIVEPSTAMPVFLRWLADPSDARGVYVSLGDGSWDGRSYRQLADAAHGLARRIGRSSAPAGAVAVCSERADEVLVAAGASWLLGAPIHIVAPPYAFGSAAEHIALVTRNLALSATDHLIVGRDAGPLAERIVAALAADATLTLHGVDDVAAGAPLAVVAPPGAAVHQFTSGSMGTPKLIRVSSANLDANLRGQHRRLGWRESDGASAWLPLNHDMGLAGALLYPVSNQGDLWSSSPRQFLRDPWTWLGPLGDGRATMTAGPTFGYAHAAARLAAGREATADFSTWRFATIGAELVSPGALGAFTERFARRGFSPRAFCPAYGMAECTLMATGAVPGEPLRAAAIVDPSGWSIGAPAPLGDPDLFDAHDAEAARGDALMSCGPPIDGFRVRVLDEDGEPLPDGRFGEIELSGTSLAQIASEPVPGRSPVVPATTLRTGDGGVMLDGELYVVGRLGDGLKLRGAFVDCEGLERRLLRVLDLPAGQAALAIGQLGDTVHAVLLVRRAPDLDEIPARALAVLRSVAGAGAELSIVAAGPGGVPKTSSGKPRRRLIWKQWIDSRAQAPVLAGATRLGDA